MFQLSSRVNTDTIARVLRWLTLVRAYCSVSDQIVGSHNAFNFGMRFAPLSIVLGPQNP